jgi:Na+/H+ antiporter NhaD/arsenite permease-like protein
VLTAVAVGVAVGWSHRAAGVAPLVVGNPMNLVVAERAGIGFNAYALHMIPVALAGGLTSYLLLARMFRDVLSDVAPALGAWPTMPPLPRAAWVVVAMLGVVLVAYPVVSFLDGPLWWWRPRARWPARWPRPRRAYPRERWRAA